VPKLCSNFPSSGRRCRPRFGSFGNSLRFGSSLLFHLGMGHSHTEN
jgi:hypothetical protein